MVRTLIVLLIGIGVFFVVVYGDADKQQPPERGAVTALQQSDTRAVLPTFTRAATVVLRATSTPIVNQPTEHDKSTPLAGGETQTIQATRQVQASGAVIVNTAILNVRSAPNTNGTIITTLVSGDCRPVKERAGDWYLLRLDDGGEGWSAVDYLTPTTSCSTQTAVSATTNTVALTGQQKGIVNAPSLNVRAGPGDGFAVLTQVTANDCVDVLATQAGWLQIATAAMAVGWCNQDFITLVESCPAIVQQVVVALPMAASAPSVQPSSYVGQAFAPNAMTSVDAYIFECFGSGENELRFVTAGTPVQVLGTGAFSPPYGELRNGPFLKIRIWDGQYAWIGADAVNVELATQPALSAQCESYDRLDWSTVVVPTATAYPAWMTNPTPAQPSGCCKICRKGKACGNSCISASYTCHKGPGCACDG